MSIPLVCGSWPSITTERSDVSCPVCHRVGGMVLATRTDRACFCFIPLCLMSGPEEYSECMLCRSSMPSYVAVIAPRAPPSKPHASVPTADVGVGDTEVEAGLLG